jgi:hypothetical protein
VVCAILAANGDEIDIEMWLGGVKIGSGAITASDKCLKADVAVKKVGTRAKLEVCADFSTTVVSIEGELCATKLLPLPCKKFKGKLKL